MKIYIVMSNEKTHLLNPMIYRPVLAFTKPDECNKYVDGMNKAHEWIYGFEEIELIEEGGLVKMEQYLDKTFASSTVKTPKFKQFAKDYKKALEKLLPVGLKIINYNVDHFYVSGFITDGKKFVYFSCSDLHFFLNEWYNNILIRTAKDTKDFTGGINNYTTLPEFGNAVKCLMD